MTNEEKALLDAKAKVETEAQDDSSQENTEEETSEGTLQEEKVDYKALALAEKERAEKAERALAKDRFKASEEKRKEIVDTESNDSIGDEDRPLTAKDVQQLLLKERQATQKAFQETRAMEIAKEHTSSEDEAQAALTFWRTRVNPTGNLEDDILFAIGGLNYRKATAKTAELARALKAKDGVSRETATTFRDAALGTAPKLSSGDAAAYKRAGFEYDNAGKVWKKKLPNGKFLLKDPRTKQTRVA